MTAVALAALRAEREARLRLVCRCGDGPPRDPKAEAGEYRCWNCVADEESERTDLREQRDDADAYINKQFLADRRLLERCREVLTAETESVRAADLLDDLDARLGSEETGRRIAREADEAGREP